MVFGKQPKLLPAAYRDTMLCYGHNTTRRRYRSTVVYQPKIVPESFSDTCYVRPKRLSNTFVSYLDTGPDNYFRRKWFSSAVRVEPKTVSNVMVSGFEWLTTPEETPDWTADHHVNESCTSSGICSEDEDEADWSRAHRHRVLNFEDEGQKSTTLIVQRS